MKRLSAGLVMLLVAAPLAGADERIASEDFSGAGPPALAFSPDNAAGTRPYADPSAQYPFDRLLELPAGAAVRSTVVALGPEARGGLEDVVWVRLASLGERYSPGRETFTAVAFTGGGPEVRLIRDSKRPEAALEWFDGAAWHASGVSVMLDRDYRMRTVMDLDGGMLDIWLRQEPGGKERAVVLGGSFGPFSDRSLRRSFSLGRTTGMKVAVAAWQLWRTGRSDFPRTSLVGGGAAREGTVVVRCRSPVGVAGDAVSESAGGDAVRCYLMPVPGLHDDMELADVSGWRPVVRVQRRTSFRHSGSWSLGLSEGTEPVDVDLGLPEGDFEVKIFFLIPPELPANRQIYLVRFHDSVTDAEPVGPSIYLDYGASAKGGSLLIFQLRPDAYHSEQADVRPGKWYGLRLVVKRRLGVYVAYFIGASGEETPINGARPLGFFQGRPLAQRVQWRFFSIVSMRQAPETWPKIDVELRDAKAPVVCPSSLKSRLTGLTLKGLRADELAGVDFTQPGSVLEAVRSRGSVVDSDRTSLKLSDADAGKLADYELLALTGNVYLPWADVQFSHNADGRMWLWVGGTEYSRGEAAPPGEFQRWLRAQPSSAGPPMGLSSVMLIYERASRRDGMRAEVRWLNPRTGNVKHVPVPPELFRGGEAVIDHPGAPCQVKTSAVIDGKSYVSLSGSALVIHDRQKIEKSREIVDRQNAVFTWDAHRQCFWVAVSTGPSARGSGPSGSRPRAGRGEDGDQSRVLVLDRNLNVVGPGFPFRFNACAIAVGPEEIYFVSTDGTVVCSDRLLSSYRSIPLDKMFGGKPLVSAAACSDRYLYLAMRPDSPVLPSHVVCIDTTHWNPLFGVDLSTTYPTVTSMAVSTGPSATSRFDRLKAPSTSRGSGPSGSRPRAGRGAADGDMMHLFNTDSPKEAFFGVPSGHDLASQGTFIYLDDLEVMGAAAVSTRLLAQGPEPAEGGVRGVEGGRRPSQQSAGSVTSSPALLDADLRTLECVSWEEVPFDPATGSLKMFVRTADDKYFMDRLEWMQVENGRRVAMPLKRYLQWRLEMSAKDLWRTPGISNLAFALSARGASSAFARSGGWVWLLLIVVVAGVVSYFLIGRRAWWQRRTRRA